MFACEIVKLRQGEVRFHPVAGHMGPEEE